jgi:hypothetical protein
MSGSGPQCGRHRDDCDTIRQLDRKALSTARDVTDHIDRLFVTVDREFGQVDCWPRSWRGML